MAQLRILGWLVLGLVCVTQSLELSAADNRVQVLNFSMDRCEPCRLMQPVLAKLIMDGWQVRDIDVAEEPKLVGQFKLKSAPTIIVLVDNREVDRVVGTIAYDKLLARLQAASQKSSAIDRTESLAANTTLAQPATQNPAFGQRSGASTTRLEIEPAMVRGQSPGPAEVPELKLDDDRMLGFVKDLPDPPKFANSASPAEPSPMTLASASGNNARAAVQPAAFPPSNSSSMQAAVQPAAAAVRPARLQYDPIARAQLATVRICIEDANSIAYGTGTVIYVHGEQALLLTCGHLFRDIGKDAQMSVDVFDNAGRKTRVPAQVVSHSTEQGDIGLMEFRCPYPITPVPIAKVAPQLNEPAFSYGCDKGADPTRRDTYVKKINRYLGPANIEIHGAPVVGRSGGALFNAQGQIIGVCNAADAEDDEGIYAALPVIDQHIAALRLSNLPTDDFSADANIQLASASSADRPTAPTAPRAGTTGATAATQVRCVIRDAQGKETALLIDRPSEELVALLRQASTR
jgi:thiol-disulfide isomerase/thioredoxin